MKAILGKKIGMTQIFSPEGKAIPVTVIEAGPCTVIQTKTTDNDHALAHQAADIQELSVSTLRI